MKRIVKNPSPAQYEAWRKQDGEETTYVASCTEVRKLCIHSLLQEQGGLCCYTGMRVKENSAHIEHLHAQSLSRQSQTNEDLDYRNMLAAYPKTGGCPYGAMFKGNNSIGVTPLDADCETRFVFDIEGKIACRRANDAAAANTIDTLDLNHNALASRRKTAIDEALFTKELSDNEILRRKAQMQQRNKHGDYPAFCFVIEQACDLAVAIRAKRAQKKKYASQSRHANRR